MGKGRQQVIDKLRKLLEDRDAISVSDRVIFCRNVMIYFDKPTQQELINRFWDYLEPGGHLFVGHSEGLSSVKHRFRYVRPAVYQK